MANNFPYTLNRPNPPNNPSSDAPDMRTNTNSISSLINIDHVGFGINGSGIHRQVTLASGGTPGLGDGNGVLFATQQNGNSWPAWVNSSGATVMMTSTANSTSVGYTPLPGGLLLQYGTLKTTGASTPVVFGTGFTSGGVASNALSVVCTPITSIASAFFTISNVTDDGFNYIRPTSSEYFFYWFAIGTKT